MIIKVLPLSWKPHQFLELTRLVLKRNDIFLLLNSLLGILEFCKSAKMFFTTEYLILKIDMISLKKVFFLQNYLDIFN